jgi:hypothetical protein
MTPYATIAEFRLSSKLTGGSDAQVQMCLDAAAAAIDGFCNRPDGFDAGAATARTFALRAGQTCLEIQECVSVTQVEILSDGVWAVLASDLWEAFSGDEDEPLYTPPHSAIRILGSAYTSLTKLRVTAAWGASADVPPTVKTATLAQATKWFKRFEGSFSNALATNNLGRKAFVQALDPDVEFMLVSARLVRPAV